MTIDLRPATAADAEAVWAWNAAPDVRAWSGAGEPIAWPTHVAWYAARLARVGEPMWIVERDGAGVGVVRIDAAPARARLSIALAADARGQGVGRAAIQAALAAWQRPIAAEIFADNRRSRACFEACGFRPIELRDRRAIYHWDPEQP